MTELHRHALPDGREIAYATYGDPDGPPVLLLHGLVGSVVSPWFALGLQGVRQRVIAVARPGYGASSPWPMTAVHDWARGLSPWLQSLGLSRWDVFAISAGAPYGYSLASAYPEAVGRVVMCSGLPAVCEADVLKHYPAGADAFYAAMRHLPDSLALAQLKSGFLKGLEAGPDADDTLAHGGAGLLREVRLQPQPWGFAWDSVQAPVTLVHSRADTLVPYAAVAATVERLPQAELITLENEPHVSPTTFQRAWQALG